MTRNGWRPRVLRTHLGRPPLAGGYYAPFAEQRARILRRKPRTTPKLLPGTPLWDRVISYLRRGLSPEQIASTLALMPDPVRLSHETIYTALYAMPRGQLRARVLTLLRRRHKQRRSRSGKVTRPFLDAITLIDDRPAEVAERLVPGHWEGDLIKGAGNRSAVGTLIDRSTLFVMLVKIDGSTAEAALDAYSAAFAPLPAELRQTLTYDQGKEMAEHKKLAEATGIRIYFCDPHSPWQRGICENTNGLLRQYLPKGTDLSVFSQRQLDLIAMRMNIRPRKTLGWKTPAEAFMEKCAEQDIAINPAVALSL
jgi:IS30 family transposase